MEPYSSDDIKRRKKKQYPDKFNPEDQLCPYCRAASKCFALVSDAQRRIYIWKGRESSVRARFLGNRVAYEIRDQLGKDYRIIPVDEGSEDELFIDLLSEISSERVCDRCGRPY